MKKLVSLVLALIMVLSMASFAGAEEIALTWAMGCGATGPIDNAMVLEELNKMSSEKIGVTCQIEYMTNDQMLNSIQNGEVYDIYYTCSWLNNTTDRISEGIFADVKPYLENVPGLVAEMSQDVWDLATHPDGSIYAIPVKKDYATMNFIYYPSKLAEELGYTIPEKVASWDELTEFLTAWKATLPENQYPVNIGGAPAGLESSFDFISRTAQIGLVFGDEEAKVVTIFDDPDIMDRYRTMYKWYQAGLVNPDAATITETSVDGDKERINFVQAWPGYDYTVANGWPTKMTCYFGPNLSVDTVQGSMNALSVTLEEDEARMIAALKYLELCYVDQLFVDTMRYGVQGYHWNYVTEEQSAACAGGVLRTQVGSDNYNPWGFSQPAYFNSSIAVSQDQIDGLAPAPVFEQYDMYYTEVANNAKVSTMNGFVWDNSAWTAELAEITNIYAEYSANYKCGVTNIDDVLPEMMEKLNAAGLQTLIADAQEQLDKHLGK